MYRQWREGKDAVLTMVLIQDMLMFLLLPTHDAPIPDTNKDNKSTKSATITALANKTQNNNDAHNTVVVEHGPA